MSINVVTFIVVVSDKPSTTINGKDKRFKYVLPFTHRVCRLNRCYNRVRTKIMRSRREEVIGRMEKIT